MGFPLVNTKKDVGRRSKILLKTSLFYPIPWERFEFFNAISQFVLYCIRNHYLGLLFYADMMAASRTRHEPGTKSENSSAVRANKPNTQDDELKGALNDFRTIGHELKHGNSPFIKRLK
jgi:hypothetical protein